MAILRVRLADGRILEIPSIKGADGKDGTVAFEDLTEAQKLSLKGDKGDPGTNGNSPYVGSNGNWWVGETDTGVSADYSGQFAPSGYGLGEDLVLTTADLNTYLKNGYYNVWSQTPNTPFSHGAVLVFSYSPNEVVQYVMNTNSGILMIRRTLDGGATWTEEWAIPPMVTGVEYLTTEKYNGKSVYTKLVDFGALPNASAQKIAHNSNVDRVIRCVGSLNDGQSIPYYHSANDWISCWGTLKYVYVSTSSDYSSRTANVQIWYTLGETTSVG